MKKRRWLPWTLLVLAVLLLGAGVWIKKVIDHQPVKHSDPGIPDDLDVPDPDEVE